MGNSIEPNASILKCMVNEGHAIGNHTMTHARFSDVNNGVLRSEIEGASHMIERTSSVVPYVLRTPFGVINAEAANASRANGLGIVLWSIYPDESSYFASAASITERIVSSAMYGDILFPHDTSQCSVEMAQFELLGPSIKGFRFVTISELIKRHGELVPGATYETAYTAE